MKYSEDLEVLAAGCSGGKKITSIRVFGQVHGKKDLLTAIKYKYRTSGTGNP